MEMDHLPTLEDMLSQDLLTEDQVEEIMDWFRDESQRNEPFPERLLVMVAEAIERSKPRGMLLH